MVSVSTTAKVGSRHPERLVWWFPLGFLKVLLSKPGTLHSPGHIFPSALGVPPDLREASGFRRLVKNHGRVGMWLRPHRSRGSVVPQLPGRGRVPRPKRMWDRLSTRLPCHSLLIIHVPYARYYATSWLSRTGQGERGRLAHLVLALHPTGSYFAAPASRSPPVQIGVLN